MAKRGRIGWLCENLFVEVLSIDIRRVRSVSFSPRETDAKKGVAQFALKDGITTTPE